MSEIERLNMIAEWQEQHKQLIEDLDNSKKRIAELEHQLTHRNCLDCSNHSSNLRIRNLELEKENAELKKLKRECETSICRAEYQYNYEQLTKAKELLNEFMRISKASDEDFEHDYSELIGEAEQFINSEVEK